MYVGIVCFPHLLHLQDLPVRDGFHCPIFMCTAYQCFGVTRRASLQGSEAKSVGGHPSWVKTSRGSMVV